MKNTCKARLLAATLLAIGAHAGAADAAIVISINRTSGEVSVSGSYKLLGATGTATSQNLRIPDAIGNWDFVTDGSGTSLSPPVSGPSFSLYFPLGSVSWSILDVSNSNLALISGRLDNFFFDPNSPFIGLNGTRDFGNYDSLVDSGDVLSINGNFTLAAGEVTKLDPVSDGVHVSSYNKALAINIKV